MVMLLSAVFVPQENRKLNQLNSMLAVFNIIVVFIIVVAAFSAMTTISIKEETRRELLRIAGEIQQRTQERVDFDTVIQALIDVYEKRRVDTDAWAEFTKPVEGVDFETAYEELIFERGRDNE